MARLVPTNPENPLEALTSFENAAKLYLGHLGLPTEGVLVTIQERAKVAQNIPDIVTKE